MDADSDRHICASLPNRSPKALSWVIAWSSDSPKKIGGQRPWEARYPNSHCLHPADHMPVSCLPGEMRASQASVPASEAKTQAWRTSHDDNLDSLSAG